MVRTPSTMLPLGTEAAEFLLTNVDGRSFFQTLQGARDSRNVYLQSLSICKTYSDGLAALGHEYMTKGIGMAVINSNDVAAHPADSPEQMVHERSSGAIRSVSVR